METKKMTKREMFAALMAKYDMNEEEKAFLTHEIELLTKKAGKDRKPTANQLANQALKAEMLELMEDNRVYTCTELSKELQKNHTENISVNKTSALLTQLISDGLVVKTVEKRKSYFSKVLGQANA